MDQVLPHKEASLFKSILEFHEHRQYKQGAKACDQILKKCPNHAETIAMKGLCLGHLEKKDDGFNSVRKAIKLNPKSHVCWHVYGLLYRLDKNYEEAIKCYKVALRCDPGNHQIWRDLAVLQLQVRQLEDHLESRGRILHDRPMVKSNWIALAVAHHLCKDHAEAVKAIDLYLEELAGTTGVLRTSILDNEVGQIHLYKSHLLEESGLYEDCLSHLEDIRFLAGDVLGYASRKARLLLKCKRHSEAGELYGKLFEYVPESLEYLQGLEQSRGVDLSTLQEESKFIDELHERYPRSCILRSRYLPFLLGDKFANAFKQYAMPLLKKGAPSLFTSVKHLYTDKERTHHMELTVMSLRDTFANLEDSRSMFWAEFFLAQHYDRLGKLTDALTSLDKAYSINATIPDLFLLYGRILKHAGHLDLASECMSHAMQSDVGDRFLASKCSKYLLRAGKIQQAKDVMARFIKGDTQEAKFKDLTEMQCMWFNLEYGLALKGEGRLREALDQFQFIYKNFDDFVDDQMDFHNYVLRKMTLVPYTDLLHYLDRVYSEKIYSQAGALAVECCLALMSAKPALEVAMDSLSIKDSPDYLAIAQKWLTKLQKYHADQGKVYALAFQVNMKTASFCKAIENLHTLRVSNRDISIELESLKMALESGHYPEERALLSRLNLESSVSVPIIDPKEVSFELLDDQLKTSPFIRSLCS